MLATATPSQSLAQLPSQRVHLEKRASNPVRMLGDETDQTFFTKFPRLHTGVAPVPSSASRCKRSFGPNPVASLLVVNGAAAVRLRSFFSDRPDAPHRVPGLL